VSVDTSLPVRLRASADLCRTSGASDPSVANVGHAEFLLDKSCDVLVWFPATPDENSLNVSPDRDACVK